MKSDEEWNRWYNDNFIWKTDWGEYGRALRGEDAFQRPSHRNYDIQSQSNATYTPAGHSHRGSTAGTSGSAAGGESEDVIAGLLSVAVGIAVGFLLWPQKALLGGYAPAWALGAGVVACLLTGALFRGPLRPLMTVLKWLIVIAFYGGIVFGIVWLWNLS